jgi:hypothetical protein
MPRFLYNMNATGRINISSIRIHELERNIDNLSTGTISPPTGAGFVPLSVGPDLTVKACIRLAFKSINCCNVLFHRI